MYDITNIPGEEGSGWENTDFNLYLTDSSCERPGFTI